MRKRSVARECALKVLYQIEVGGRPAIQALKDFWEQEADHPSEVQEFTTRIVEGVSSRRDDLDQGISKYATNWQVKRMAVIDRNVLRMGLFELKFSSDIPPKVAINEAVDLAKKYGDMDSGKFVNGILDRVLREEVGVPPPSA
ncbi:MAG: transcription antitermination factor NusB [Elusimicrobia bacterium]|nr:transcription antitermination factor NusB [Elusimicrobiota bacterium]